MYQHRHLHHHKHYTMCNARCSSYFFRNRCFRHSRPRFGRSIQISLFGHLFVPLHPQYVRVRNARTQLDLVNSLYIMKMSESILHLFCSLPFVHTQFGICVLLSTIFIILIALTLPFVVGGVRQQGRRR